MKLVKIHWLRQLFMSVLFGVFLFQTTSAWSQEVDKDEAARHFQQGVELHDAGDYRGAQIEFRQAYRLAPIFHLLYNLGQESVELKEYVEAHKNFVQYLQDGGDEIAPERRVAVTREIARISKYLASIELKIVEVGAEISVDGIIVGVSPLAKPIQVSIGRRKIVVSLQGHAVWERTVDVAGEDHPVVEVKLLSLTMLPAQQVSSSRPTRFWLSLGATGLFIAGTGVLGVVTLNAKSDHEDEVNTIDERSAADKLKAIDDSAKKYKRMALYTDIGIGLSIVGVVTTIIFSGAESNRDTETSLHMVVAPSGVGFAGRF